MSMNHHVYLARNITESSNNSVKVGITRCIDNRIKGLRGEKTGVRRINFATSKISERDARRLEHLVLGSFPYDDKADGREYVLADIDSVRILINKAMQDFGIDGSMESVS